MTAIRPIARFASLAGLLAGLAAIQPARAGEVMIFTGPAPQAAELARILWPSKRAGGSPVGLTRSIRINAEPAPAAPAMARVAVEAAPAAARVQVAAAEPATASDAAPETSAAAPDAFGFPIRFAFDSTEVLPESRPYLDSVGAMLRLPEAQGKRVVIVGHTDAAGSNTYNQALSERRAVAVRAYLAARFGIDAARLEVVGEGEQAPLPGLDPYAAQNRRVEFHAAG